MANTNGVPTGLTPNLIRQEVIIWEYERGLLYREGRFMRLLEPGRYRFWNWEKIRVTKTSTRQMSEVITGQEILTADKIEVRISLIAQYVVSDPVLAINSSESYTDQLHQDLQLTLREAIASRNIDQLLEAREEISTALLERVAPQALTYGVTLKRLGIRDIVLPGVVRNVFLKEVEADRTGRADLIRARHEVAAARARSNTAKILAENPNVARMQEIDALVALAGKAGNVVLLPNLADLFVPRNTDTTVSGNGNGQKLTSRLDSLCTLVERESGVWQCGGVLTMWDSLPDPVRKLFGMPPARRYRTPVANSWEWPLYMLATYRLGMSMDIAYKLMDGGPMPARFRYRHFSVPKKDSTQRDIAEPGPSLKVVQRKILRLFLNKPKPHPAALGFRRKKSIADHAWAHAGAAIVITADIEDFFPNTSRQRVKNWWHAQGYSTLETRLLTSLTTYRGSLPQGAPTSPALSNLINCDLDAALDRRARQCSGTYTRYSDDLVFSWPHGWEPPADFEQAVRAVLREYGYALHPHKGWHVWRRRDEPEITGVHLTRQGAVDIPASMRRIMRVLARSQDADDQARLAGYRGYEKMITRHE